MIHGVIFPHLLVKGGCYLLHYIFCATKRPVFSRRHWRAVDYHPQAGLIMAGGNSRWSKIVEQSKNYGHTFRRLADIPYAGTPSWYGVLGACLVIINETTAVLIGGRYNCRFF